MGSNSLEMAFKMRSTKFRHVYGSPFRKEHCYENVRITRNAHESHFCAVNLKFVAVVTESSGGGCFVVLPIEKTGRVDINSPKVCGHAGAVMDIKWNPFNENIIASGADDSTIKLWQIPDEGLYSNLTEWSVDLHGHQRKVGYVEWHPTAENILLSVGFDFKCIVWNVEQAEPVNIIDSHNDTIFSMYWNNDGSLFCTTSKDRRIRVIDPRIAQVAIETEGHAGTKSCKGIFLRDNHRIVTTGFSRMSSRQFALWDVRHMNSPVVMTDIDHDSGTLLPYYDPDLNIVYLAGKGNGNIRYYEVASEEPYVHFLNAYQSSSPQRGLGMMPKRGCDVTKCEVLRFYKLHAGKNLIEPISMICPRKSDKFQEDIYPPTRGTIPSLGPDEWIAGQNRDPILVSVADGHVLNTPNITASKAVQKQEGALNRAPTITTYKAVNKQNLENIRGGPRRANTIATETVINNNNHEEPASLQNIKRLSTNEDFVSIKPMDSQRIQQRDRYPTSQKQHRGPETVRHTYVPLETLVCDITSDLDDNLPDNLYDNDQDITAWQEDTLSDHDLRLDEFDLQFNPPVYASSSMPYMAPAESRPQRSYQQQPDSPKSIEPEVEQPSAFLKMKETVKRNLEMKPIETTHASIYDKERERIRPLARSSSEGGLRKSFYENEQDITAWQEDTLKRPKGLPPVNMMKQNVASTNILQRPTLRSMKKRVQNIRKGDAESYNPEEERNPSFSQAKRYLQKQAQVENTRPKSMVDMDTSKLDQDLLDFQQRSSKPLNALGRQRSLENDEFTHEQFNQAKRLLEQQTQPGIQRQTSLDREERNKLTREPSPPYPIKRRSYESLPKEETPKRLPKAGSTSPFAKRREVRSSELPASTVEKLEKSPFTNRASFPKLKCETIVTSRPFVPFEMQTPHDNRREHTYTPPRLPEKTIQPAGIYRQSSLDKEINQLPEEQPPTFSQARRNFESPTEDLSQRLPKAGSLSPFTKRKEIRSTPVTVTGSGIRERGEYVSPFSNRASYPQMNQENISTRVFEFPPPSPTDIGHQPQYGSIQPPLYGNKRDRFSPPVNSVPPNQPKLHQGQTDTYIKKDKSRGFDYQPVQKVEPYQPLSDNRRNSAERRDTNKNIRTSEERHVSKATFTMNVGRPKDVSGSLITDSDMKRTSFPPVSSKRYEPMVPAPQTYENDVDIAAWEEDALRNYEPRISKVSQGSKHTADRRSGSASPKVFLREKYPPPPPSPSEVADFSERKAMFETTTPSPVNESPAPQRVEKRVWSPTSPIYKDPSTNGIFASDSDKELSPIISTAVFRPSNGTIDVSQESPRNRRPRSEILTSGYSNRNLAKLVIGEPNIQPTHKIHVRKMWQQPQHGEDYSHRNAPNTDAELKKAYFRQQDEIRQLQEQITLKDKRIRQLEEEVRGIRETSCGPGESNC
ncbi:uncharacterized protein LOC126816312 isoform X5 [Patella vulgata]|uniref:uncharacterized protein LOC126816312 isoform X5 n=1 Tax=Patella vulgata TaxID=6465 RepID=UPI0024A92231|nr:uncharacterized protein LOC126816312 isoform X5 [Patella vulgata]